MKRLAILFALLSTPAFAQQGPAEYTLKLRGDQVNIIGQGLDELPGHIRRPVAEVIGKQINDQNTAFTKAEQDKADAAKVEKPKK